MKPTSRRRRLATILAVAALLAGCATPAPQEPVRRPADVREQIVDLLPPSTADREGWAVDIHAAFSALEVSPTASNLCAALAVTDQESNFNADPVVPGLSRIARAEIDRRAARLKVPQLIVKGALRLSSPDGRTWGDRIASVRTEKQMSRIFEDFISTVPMGRRLFGNANPVRTAGPMQVSIAFAERLARERPYPYPLTGSVRDEVFSRRGGMYFGIAHLLAYPAPYRQPLHRFADFNAGWYASRNAAFQEAVSLASGIPLAIDGDLVLHGVSGDRIGTTEAAVRAIARALDLDNAQIRRALELGDRLEFERTPLYQRVFALAEQMERRLLPRAVIPRITLESPKITRKLTTEWFATRVDQRYQRCMVRASR